MSLIKILFSHDKRQIWNIRPKTCLNISMEAHTQTTQTQSPVHAIEQGRWAIYWVSENILKMCIRAASWKQREQRGWICKDGNYKSEKKVVMSLPLMVRLHWSTVWMLCLGWKKTSNWESGLSKTILVLGMRNFLGKCLKISIHLIKERKLGNLKVCWIVCSKFSGYKPVYDSRMEWDGWNMHHKT